ncbi:glycoside hydrolase family 79 protein [Coniochaeta ligniaria NRRL 30616]|uniref:Glycoside hydrolase family 79 protein n=1 Tax=Coniochaeta ligniaria NRRL 30616 TaxID=1408157 RepID=A0A1J7JTU8_9PEZI|nr:glycoside hydrolase family 79 protein [Coniochaeta ligniaria NRRL 30616]
MVALHRFGKDMARSPATVVPGLSPWHVTNNVASARPRPHANTSHRLVELYMRESAVHTLQVSSTSTAQPIGFAAFVSLSIELVSFPLFAGIRSAPNVFSANLVTNLGLLQGGDMPVIRVGGNSQDRAIYDPELQTATATSCAADPLAIVCIGSSFFDSYRTFPDTYYSHGFNLAANNASGYTTLAETAPLACKAIGSQLSMWEYGNEPDLYLGKWRPSNWNVSQFVTEWLNGTSHLKEYLLAACPELGTPQFMAPSFSSPGSSYSHVAAFQDGLDSQDAVNQKSLHNYITGATSPGVTLQGTLMNHNVTVKSLSKHVAAANALAAVDDKPYVIGECNSLYGGGAAGLSDTFGAALWVMDFTLYAASTGVIKRLHYHQSNGAPYSAWAPVPSGGNQPTTLPPYYGKLAAARFLSASNSTAVEEIALSSSPYESAYAAYTSGHLARIAVLNMNQYNATSASQRPSTTYTFLVGNRLVGSSWLVEKLAAPGSDVKTGVTFAGYKYEYSSLGNGVNMKSNCPKEVVKVGSNGELSVRVKDSQAVVLTLLDE